MSDHRAVLSPAQYDWPKETLENPEELDLLKAAACIRGYIDCQDYLTNKILRPIAELLERRTKLERRSRKDQRNVTKSAEA